MFSATQLYELASCHPLLTYLIMSSSSALRVGEDSKTGAERHPIQSPWESVTSLFSSAPGPSSSSSTSSGNGTSSTTNQLSEWTSSISRDPVMVGVISAVGATALTLGGLTGYRRYWRRIRNSDYVTSGMLDRKRWVKGVVTRCVPSIAHCALRMSLGSALILS